MNKIKDMILYSSEIVDALIVHFLAKLFVVILVVGLPWWKIALIIIVPPIIELIGGAIIRFETLKNEGDHDGDRIDLETDAVILEDTRPWDCNHDNHCGEYCDSCVRCQRHDKGVQESPGNEGLGEGAAERPADEE